jgi:hypothetical protein
VLILIKEVIGQVTSGKSTYTGNENPQRPASNIVSFKWRTFSNARVIIP